jgi:hypothetical protein
MTRYCSRCESAADRPIEQNMNYVRASDFAEEQAVEVYYAMMHTDETLAELDRIDDKIEERDRQALAAETAHPDADDEIEYVVGTERVENDDGSFVETAEKEKVAFSIPTEDFRHIEVETPDVVRDDEMVALTYTNTERRRVDKTGLVCPGCVKEDDEIIWGPTLE